MRKQAGFTLIEIVIALAILATISVLAVTTINSGFKARAKIQTQIDDVSKIRDALRLMERDLNLAYHHYDFELAIKDRIKKLQSGATNNNLTQPGFNPPTFNPAPSPPVEAPRKSPDTFFVGQENELHFVSLNSGRISRNIKQADFIEIGYSLKNCKSVDGSKDSKCLWRRTSAIVDKDVTTGGDELVLLENVTEFSLKYIGEGKTDWVKEWRSDSGGDAATKGRFPMAVEISLTVQKEAEGKQKFKKYSMQIVASIHNPANPSSDSNSPAGGTGTTTSPNPLPN